MSVELSLRGGLVIDGTGSPGYRADVGVSEGRIVRIAPSVRGEREIDCSGLVVAPGFLDIHTHYDAQVMWDPWLTPSFWHGVTSLVMGNCGFSIAPCADADRTLVFRTLETVEDMNFDTLRAGVSPDYVSYGDYLTHLERRGTAINVGGYVGHTAVRIFVMGDDAYERAATPEEIEQMRAVVRDALHAGALGFSTSISRAHRGDQGRPVPSTVATRDEVLALMAVPGEERRGIVHIAAGEDYEWLYDFAASAKVPITWNSILTFPEGTAAFTPYREKLARHQQGRQRSPNVWVQVTCRPITTQITMRQPMPFNRLPAFLDVMALDADERGRCYEDPAWRDRARAELDDGQYLNPRWDTFEVAESPASPDVVGRTIAELAKARGEHPFDVLLDVARADDYETRFRIVFANDDVDGVSMLLAAEGCIVGLSDAGAHVGQLCDANLPTDFLANWVRDRGVLPIEQGIRKLTGELADVLCFSERGYVREGAAADLVVLDVDRLDPGRLHRVRDLPAGGERLVADEPTGIEHVFVGGVEPPTPGSDTIGPLPGTVLRSPLRTSK